MVLFCGCNFRIACRSLLSAVVQHQQSCGRGTKKHRHIQYQRNFRLKICQKGVDIILKKVEIKAALKAKTSDVIRPSFGPQPQHVYG